jgi:hypothetical protein
MKSEILSATMESIFAGVLIGALIANHEGLINLLLFTVWGIVFPVLIISILAFIGNYENAVNKILDKGITRTKLSYSILIYLISALAFAWHGYVVTGIVLLGMVWVIANILVATTAEMKEIS